MQRCMPGTKATSRARMFAQDATSEVTYPSSIGKGQTTATTSPTNTGTGSCLRLNELETPSAVIQKLDHQFHRASADHRGWTCSSICFASCSGQGSGVVQRVYGTA